MRLKLLASALIALSSTTVLADDLLEVYNLAQTKDPIILQQKAERDRAYEAINQAQAANLPQINLQGTAKYVKTNKDDKGTAFVAGGNISLQQAIWRHSNILTKSIAEKTATMADLQYNDAKQKLIMRVSQAYFGILLAKDELEFANANMKALQKQYDEANQRFKVGLIANTDVQEAKAAYDQATAQSIIAENELANSLENLREITGLAQSNLNHIDVANFTTKKLDTQAADWLKISEENNLQLQAAMIQKEIAKDNISLAQTGYEPTLDLFGSVGTEYTDYKKNTIAKEDGSLNSGVIGVEFNMPLYSGGATSSASEQAKLAYVSASENLELAHRQVQTNIYSQYNNINAAIGTVKAYEQSVISADSALNATTAGYQVGTRTIVDVLDATKSLYNAKSSLAQARYSYILNWLNLRYTSGLLNEDDLKTINSSLIK